MERFYLQKFAEVKAESESLIKLMDAKATHLLVRSRTAAQVVHSAMTRGRWQGGSVAGMVKSSWKHTEDLRGL